MAANLFRIYLWQPGGIVAHNAPLGLSNARPELIYCPVIIQGMFFVVVRVKSPTSLTAGNTKENTNT